MINKVFFTFFSMILFSCFSYAEGDATNLNAHRIGLSWSSDSVNNALTVSPYGDGMFNERIDMASGGVSFFNDEINLPGNFDLPMSINYRYDTNYPFYRGWYVDTARISYTFVSSTEDTSTLPESWRNKKFCSQELKSNRSEVRFLEALQVSGNFEINIPGQIQSLLVKNEDKWGKSKSEYPYITKDNWIISCYLEGGSEGFVAHSPAGDKYYFTDFSISTTLNEWGQIIDSSRDVVYWQYRADLKLTRVEDKFGNWINYSYSPLKITASDGRVLEAEKGGDESNRKNVQNSTVVRGYNESSPDEKKEWTIVNYKSKSWRDPLETEFFLPSGRSWKYKLNYVDAEPADLALASGEEVEFRIGCGLVNLSKQTLTVKHPSNAVANFYVQQRGDSSVNLPYPSSFGPLPYCSPRLSVTKKEVNYSKDKNYVWLYTYSKARNDYSSYGEIKDISKVSDKKIFSGDAPDNIIKYYFKWTKIQAPDGSSKKYYINRDNRSPYQGRVFAIETKEKLGEPDKKIEKFDFWSSTSLGVVHSSAGSNMSLSQQQVALSFHSVEIDNTIYNNTYKEFNKYGVAKNIIQELNGDKFVIKKSYFHDEENWMLNLPTTNEYTIYSGDELRSKQTSETKYSKFSSGNNNFSNLYLKSSFLKNGLEQYSYLSYHDDGNVNKIERNGSSFSGNKISEVYSIYNAGIATSLAIKNRYEDGFVNKTYKVGLFGEITEEVDFNGNTAYFGYDEDGRVTSINLEDESSNKWMDTKFEWDDTTNTRTIKRCKLNELKECTESTPSVKVVETYDNLLRLTQTKTIDDTANADATTSVRYQNFEYDYQNRQTFASFVSTDSTESKGSSTTYDALGRTKTVSVSGLGETKYEYLADNKIKVTDPLSNVITTTYQAFGTPEYKIATFIDSPEEVDTSIAVNLFGQVEAITQSGSSSDGTAVSAVEKRVYDTNQNLCVITRPDVGNTIFGYNALGQMIWKKEGVTDTDCVATKPADAIEYVYDNVGDLYKINYPENSNTPSVTYTLDNNGNLTGLTAGDVTHSYVYNNQNLLEVEQLLIKGQLPLEIDYGYNALQQRSHLAYPDGTTVYFNPNGYGEPTRTVTYKAGTDVIELKFATDASYYANGMLKGFTYGNGVTHSLTLDQTSLLPDVLQDSRDTKNIVKLDYSFDKGGNVTAILDEVQPTYSLTSLVYDDLHRLTSVTGGTAIGNSSIKYDALGNIESYTSKDRNLTYTYNRTTNRLSSVKGAGTNGKYANLGYDTRGNIINNGAYQLNFNLANQLTSAKNNTYLYDGHNRRVKQVEQSGTSYSLYSQDGTLLYREKGDTITGDGVNYIYLGKKLIAKYGDVKPTSEADSRQHYRPFGETLETPKDDVGYTGHKFDKELGLSYMQARYYDPVIGRFYSNDPVDVLGHMSRGENVHGFNRYNYAYNNPFKYIDPDGEAPKSNRDGDAGAAIAAAILVGTGVWTDEQAQLSKGIKPKTISRAKRRASRAAQRAKTNPRVATSQASSNVQANTYGEVNLRGQTKVGMDGKTDIGIQDGSKDRGNNTTDHKPAIDVGNLKAGEQPGRNGQPRIKNEHKVKEDIKQ
ncbi:RHS repeat-associated core domain-containing protein [Pseudoalteromonas sp. OF7H-1]|uniref:RHS repeat domain-containing protein n=1 Tax=Pseudoalteromonas sp. OF7H-1 TaxID=2917755 RepID=UPI001EF61E17|nr:RHS repeat-associated core domain-containing protein [Pseudoalteromonas sp. OF7H-1]MCG7542542.1 RHS repeat-associated core domain-containing protein [Pseudoalteromonas sp. OF7H-1]